MEIVLVGNERRLSRSSEIIPNSEVGREAAGCHS